MLWNTVIVSIKVLRLCSHFSLFCKIKNLNIIIKEKKMRGKNVGLPQMVFVCVRCIRDITQLSLVYSGF